MGIGDAYEKFNAAVRGGFIGLAIGDALGVPVETMTREQILAATDDKGVTCYLTPRQTRIKDTANLPAGSTSDDTQLALVTSRSLVRRHGFDLYDQGLGLVDEYQRSTFGWGGTTTDAAKAMMLWRDTCGNEGRSPTVPVRRPDHDGASAGSGPAMKIYALAVSDLFGRDTSAAVAMFHSHAIDLGRMTHGDLRACVASVALGHAIAAFANAPDVWDAKYHRHTVDRIMEMTICVERSYRYCNARTPPFSAHLEHALNLIGNADALRTEVNKGFLAVDSVPFAIATALRHPDDFREGVLEGVNAGMDTDTIGSMVGAMLGSRAGIIGIPPEWIRDLRDRVAVLAEADALSGMLFGIDPHDAHRAVPGWNKGKLH